MFYKTVNTYLKKETTYRGVSEHRNKEFRFVRSTYWFLFIPIYSAEEVQ